MFFPISHPLTSYYLKAEIEQFGQKIPEEKLVDTLSFDEKISETESFLNFYQGLEIRSTVFDALYKQALNEDGTVKKSILLKVEKGIDYWSYDDFRLYGYDFKIPPIALQYLALRFLIEGKMDFSNEKKKLLWQEPMVVALLDSDSVMEYAKKGLVPNCPFTTKAGWQTFAILTGERPGKKEELSKKDPLVIAEKKRKIALRRAALLIAFPYVDEDDPYVIEQPFLVQYPKPSLWGPVPRFDTILDHHNKEAFRHSFVVPFSLQQKKMNPDEAKHTHQVFEKLLDRFREKREILDIIFDPNLPSIPFQPSILSSMAGPFLIFTSFEISSVFLLSTGAICILLGSGILFVKYTFLFRNLVKHHEETSNDLLAMKSFYLQIEDFFPEGFNMKELTKQSINQYIEYSNKKN